MTSSLKAMLQLFDVQPGTGENQYVGTSDAGDRQVIDGSQVLAEAIVASAKSLPGKLARSASAVFFRTVRANDPIDFDVRVLHNGRTLATTVVTASQAGRPCSTVTVMLDAPSPDVFRHPASTPDAGPDDAIPLHMPMEGREIRLVGLANPNDPDEVGPPTIDAWLRYDEVPERPEMRAALLAHFTGHLSISTAMRPHAGFGTSMSHQTLSTGVLALSVHFHEPLEWDGWILYAHESTFAGAGTSYARGQVLTADGRILASFGQDALIRRLDESQQHVAAESRL